MMPLNFQKQSVSGSLETFGCFSPHDIYNAIYPNIASFDVSSNVLQVPPGSTIENATAVAGYFRSENAAPSNAVGLFGCGMVTADHGAGWGVNTLLQDSADRAAGSGVGRVLIGAELDFNVMNPATQLIGASVGGNSLAQPSNASGFIVNTLSETYGYKWTTGYASFDGAAVNAFSAGMVAKTGANVNSQPYLFQYSDSTGAKQNVSMSVQGGGYLVWTGTAAPKGYSFKYADVFLDAGHSLRVNGVAVVGGRRTGWTLPTGAASRATFDPSTVTVEQLAQRLSALIDDLYNGHGLIGA